MVWQQIAGQEVRMGAGCRRRAVRQGTRCQAQGLVHGSQCWNVINWVNVHKSVLYRSSTRSVHYSVCKWREVWSKLKVKRFDHGSAHQNWSMIEPRQSTNPPEEQQQKSSWDRHRHFSRARRAAGLLASILMADIVKETAVVMPQPKLELTLAG